MAFINYPSELSPVMLTSGYNAGALDTRAIATPTYGGAWVRGGPKVIGGYPVTAMTDEPVGNLARFWRFWEEQLEFGHLAFRIRDQMYDGRYLSNEDGSFVCDEDGNRILIERWNIVRFDPRSGPPSAMPVQQADDLWQITMNLIVMA